MSIAIALARADCSLFLVSKTRKELDSVVEEAQKIHPSIDAATLPC